MSRGETVDLNALIDGQRSTRLHVTVAAVCAAVTFCDAFSVQAVNYAGPSLRDALRLSPAQIGAVFSLSPLGMMIGSFAIGPIADRLGPRMPMIVLTLAFGLLTGLTAAVTEFWQLAGLRFLDGLALGAALPNAYVLAAEYSPRRSRRLTIGLMMVGYTLGAYAAGATAGQLIPTFGWQAIFLIGGAAALATAGFAWLFVPDSLHKLIGRPAQRGRVERIVGLISPEHAGRIDDIAPPPPAPPAASVQILFNARYWKVTLGLWTISFAMMLDNYTFLSWTPILLRDSGIPLTEAIAITAVFNLGTIVSAVGAGWLMDRMDPARVLAALAVVGAVAVGSMGVLGDQVIAMKVATFFIGIGLGGALAGMNLLATTVYPSQARVTGSGWAISVGRLGSVIGPALGAAWVGAGFKGSEIYFAMVGPALVAAVIILLVARQISRPH